MDPDAPALFLTTAKDLSLARRAKLAREVYQKMYKDTATFEGEVGVFLAYLLGAILQGDPEDEGIGVEFDMSVPEEARALALFEDIFPEDHPVRRYFKKT